MNHASGSVLRFLVLVAVPWLAATASLAAQQGGGAASIGREVAIARHLQDGDEYALQLRHLLGYGEALFRASWTAQEGGGRPLTKGTGAPLTDPASPLLFPRAGNRVSGPDASSCADCHNGPYGIAGGGGGFATGVFVLGQRFDFATFDPADPQALRGCIQENGQPAMLQTIGNYRATPGMLGSGYVELLAREITADLQAIRDATPPGGSRSLRSKGISFGRIARDVNGAWDVSQVEGLPPPSVATQGAATPPSLVVQPFHQAGAVVSLRQFTNGAFNHHHGMQTTERFGRDTDPDGDSVANELTRADVTAITLYQATLAVPGRVIPRDPAIEQAIARGERLFTQIGCAECHVPSLRLESDLFVEPNPYNPSGNLRPGEAPPYVVDLGSPQLPRPRLPSHRGVTLVPVFTDFKLHDLCSGPNDPNIEPLEMQQPPGSPAFFAGNRRFLTKRLWGAANEPPYFHHGQFTTMRDAILAHDGEGAASRAAFLALSPQDRDCVVECLKSLQVLPPDAKHLVVDERGLPRHWQSGF